MKRSEINSAIKWAITLLEENNFKLPSFAYWSMQNWEEHPKEIVTIKKAMLGWDVTDYGRGEFDKLGGVLFTIRNGDINDREIGTPYAEKLILLKEGQYMPTHYHYTKTEDIINRSGGMIAVKLYNAVDEKTLDFKNNVTVYMDGIKNTIKAGETFFVESGNSLTITPYMFHMFGAAKGYGDLIVGEVSSINDDNVDNNFIEDLTRFINIEEDEPIMYPLCNEYSKVLKG